MQSAHACIEAAKNFYLGDDHPSVIVFGIKNEQKLKEISGILQEQGIRIREFLEPDIDFQLTAFATEPVCESQRHLFKKYCLLR